jgi:predicted peroxiredoxin
MVNIQVTGPEHSKKGYIMVVIAKALRDAGCDVSVLGEGTHLSDKTGLDETTVAERLTGHRVHITELKTGV